MAAADPPTTEVWPLQQAAQLAEHPECTDYERAVCRLVVDQLARGCPLSVEQEQSLLRMWIRRGFWLT